MTTPTPDELARLARGMTVAEKRAYLTAEPSKRALDPDSLFMCDTRGCRRGLPGTFVTLHGLMLDNTGLALRDWIKENSNG